MCGITAIIKKKNSDLNIPILIEEMNTKIKHRGPDDEGYAFFKNSEFLTAGGSDTPSEVWTSNFVYTPKEKIIEVENKYNIALGHRRLSVIDLTSAGHQPMCFNNKWIVLNGEIYNYIELRNELQDLNHHFYTNSDTEVLLKAYEVWGFKCQEKLNGMWSFIIYDLEKNLLFGSRDRFGVKPLYYYDDNQCIAFASEIKSLLQIPNNNININEKAVFEFLFNNEIEKENEGFFKNVYEIPPSAFYLYDFENETLKIEKYYNLNFQKEFKKFDKLQEKKYISETKKLIVRAVELRLRSDIPIGFCLSGGIDSSSIVCSANEILKNKTQEKIKTFTAVNKQKDFSEEKWAKKVIEKTSSLWYKIDCNSKDMMSKLESIIYYQDIPLSSTSTYSQYKVMQLASKNNIKILIDGQGGDELFAGYAPFYFAYFNELIRNCKFKTLYQEMSKLEFSPFSMKIFFKTWLKVILDYFLPMKLRVLLAKKIKAESTYFNNNFLKNLENHNFKGNYKNTKTNELLHDFFTKSFLKNLLRWEDRCSMAFSVESRTPFSDDINLIEYIFNIPANYKIKKGFSKNLLREAMKDLLPKDIKNRTDKMGFSTPQSIWLKEINKDLKYYVEKLGNTNVYIDNNKLLKDWDKIFNTEDTKKQDFIWRYVNFLLWKNMFFESKQFLNKKF